MCGDEVEREREREGIMRTNLGSCVFRATTSRYIYICLFVKLRREQTTIYIKYKYNIFTKCNIRTNLGSCLEPQRRDVIFIFYFLCQTRIYFFLFLPADSARLIYAIIVMKSFYFFKICWVKARHIKRFCVNTFSNENYSSFNLTNVGVFFV